MSKEQFRELAKKLYRVERELTRFEGTSDTQTFPVASEDLAIERVYLS